MDKLTYLAELAEGLARWVPERERQDILRYYAEYFEEAGPGREAEVVQELGDPWALSCRLAVEGGYVTQEQAASWTPKKKKRWPRMLAVGVTAVVLMFTVGNIAWAALRIGRFFTRNATSGTAGTAVVVEQDPVSTGDEFGEYYVGGTWSRESGELEVFDSIDADISLGNITVVGGDAYTISVDRNAALDGYRVDWEVKGSTLKLKDSGAANQAAVDNWDDLKEGLGNLFGDQRSVDVVITVPEMVMLEKIKAKTGLGNVMLWSVSAEKMEAETGMGNVECYNAWEAKKLDLGTGMGNVTLGLEELYDGMDIDVETGMGNVEVNLGCSERECEYELKSGMGNVTVDGYGRGSKAERKGGMPYKLDAESGMGDVNVWFTSD